MDPDREAGQLDRDLVAVDAVDAPAPYLPAQQAESLDLDAVLQVSQCFVRRLASFQARRSPRDRMQGEEGGQPSLDPVDGCDQEVSGAHRDVGAPEVEERRGRSGLVARVKVLLVRRAMVVQRGLRA